MGLFKSLLTYNWSLKLNMTISSIILKTKSLSTSLQAFFNSHSVYMVHNASDMSLDSFHFITDPIFTFLFQWLIIHFPKALYKCSYYLYISYFHIKLFTKIPLIFFISWFPRNLFISLFSLFSPSYYHFSPKVFTPESRRIF